MDRRQKNFGYEQQAIVALKQAAPCKQWKPASFQADCLDYAARQRMAGMQLRILKITAHYFWIAEQGSPE